MTELGPEVDIGKYLPKLGIWNDNKNIFKYDIIRKM
jgi:hypothetical protein